MTGITLNYIESNIINLQKIIIFDDGNHEYEMYPNEWIVCHFV
jgi:hypothetical protein